MSISSEISRISQNVSDSLTAVAAKGATVPSGANSDDLPDLIASLPSTHSVTYNLTGGATASVTPSKVVAGQGFSVKLTAPTGYVLSGVAVTMGGTDITSQVFTPDAEGGGGSEPVLQTKSVSYTPTTSAQSETVTPDSGYDGLSSVAVSVGAIPSEYVVPSGSVSITSNGTVDVTNYASAVVNVSSGGSGTQTATGTYTPASTYNTTGNQAICTLADVGFTPSRFILEMDDRANTTVVKYAIVRSSYELLGTGASPIRMTTRYSNDTGTLSTSNNGSAWTTQTNYYLYTDGTTIYLRTTSAFILTAGVTYKWTAYE